MPFESFGAYEHPSNNEQKENPVYTLDSLNDTQKQIESQARNYVLAEQANGRDITELTSDLNTLIESQRQENESLEQKIYTQTKETLDKQACIQEAKTQIYETCGISENQKQNSAFENFSKGFIDTMILDNYDMAVEVINTRGQIVLDALKQLASWEGMKQVAQALGESVWNLFLGNAYEKGQSVADLGLALTGIGAVAAIGKKGIKLGMKEISKLRTKKETIVQSSELKTLITETQGYIDTLVPKKQFYFESLTLQDISKLGDADRIEAGKFYLGRDIGSEQQQAIIKAHEVGIDRPGAGVHNYNQIEITEKTRILQEAGFSKQERRILLEKGVCGKEGMPIQDLYTKYPFLQQPEYSELRGFIEENNMNVEFVGDVVNAFVVNQP
ncbi:hypothetical protein MK079_01330, partial [Candidatus Gracilibacteria bacterium]|nr:hypothetical protein [Candidatus Gracilibacteria bacterium]